MKLAKGHPIGVKSGEMVAPIKEERGGSQGAGKQRPYYGRRLVWLEDSRMKDT